MDKLLKSVVDRGTTFHQQARGMCVTEALIRTLNLLDAEKELEIGLRYRRSYF